MTPRISEAPSLPRVPPPTNQGQTDTVDVDEIIVAVPSPKAQTQTQTPRTEELVPPPLLPTDLATRVEMQAEDSCSLNFKTVSTQTDMKWVPPKSGKSRPSSVMSHASCQSDTPTTVDVACQHQESAADKIVRAVGMGRKIWFSSKKEDKEEEDAPSSSSQPPIDEFCLEQLGKVFHSVFQVKTVVRDLFSHNMISDIIRQRLLETSKALEKGSLMRVFEGDRPMQQQVELYFSDASHIKGPPGSDAFVGAGKTRDPNARTKRIKEKIRLIKTGHQAQRQTHSLAVHTDEEPKDLVVASTFSASPDASLKKPKQRAPVLKPSIASLDDENESVQAAAAYFDRQLDSDERVVLDVIPDESVAPGYYSENYVEHAPPPGIPDEAVVSSSPVKLARRSEPKLRASFPVADREARVLAATRAQIDNSDPERIKRTQMEIQRQQHAGGPVLMATSLRSSQRLPALDDSDDNNYLSDSDRLGPLGDRHTHHTASSSQSALAAAVAAAMTEEEEADPLDQWMTPVAAAGGDGDGDGGGGDRRVSGLGSEDGDGSGAGGGGEVPRGMKSLRPIQFADLTNFNQLVFAEQLERARAMALRFAPQDKLTANLKVRFTQELLDSLHPQDRFAENVPNILARASGGVVPQKDSKKETKRRKKKSGNSVQPSSEYNHAKGECKMAERRFGRMLKTIGILDDDRVDVLRQDSELRNRTAALALQRAWALVKLRCSLAALSEAPPLSTFHTALQHLVKREAADAMALEETLVQNLRHRASVLMQSVDQTGFKAKWTYKPPKKEKLQAKFMEAPTVSHTVADILAQQHKQQALPGVVYAPFSVAAANDGQQSREAGEVGEGQDGREAEDAVARHEPIVRAQGPPKLINGIPEATDPMRRTGRKLGEPCHPAHGKELIDQLHQRH